MNLTAEQREGLDDALEFLARAEIRNEGVNPENAAKATRAKGIVQSILSTSKPAWEITEERTKALRVAVGDMDLSENIHYLGVSRNMLEEAE